MPNLSIIRKPLVLNFSVTKRFSSSTQRRRFCRLGRKRRRVLLLACETLFPVVGRLPVTSQTLDMILLQTRRFNSAIGKKTKQLLNLKHFIVKMLSLKIARRTSWVTKVGFYIRIPDQKQVSLTLCPFLDELYMQKKIKSFVLRAGRVSPRQEHGLQHLLNHYELPLAPWQFNAIFKRDTNTIVEIGFGMGRSLLEMAQANPATNYIGIEVHQAGIGALAADLHAAEVTNVKIAPYDAVVVFEQCVPDHSLAGIQIFFPDPWPKKRHYKRRLIQPEFVELLMKKLSPDGFIHIATDWEDYAQHCLTVLADYKQLINQAGEHLYVERPDTRPLTKFEQRGIKLGHGVYDLMYCLKE